jgi:hypothetical protein
MKPGRNGPEESGATSARTTDDEVHLAGFGAVVEAPKEVFASRRIDTDKLEDTRDGANDLGESH